MTDTFAVGASEPLRSCNNTKKHHRRTRSTLNLEIEGLTPKGIDKEEVAHEFMNSNDVLEADITQKILDVSIDLASDRQVLVDDIDEIPSKSAIVPKLNFNPIPFNFPKRRNLSTNTAPINNACPVRKIDLYSNLQNIDDLTGLDTIYEKRGSIESVDIETLEARHSVGGNESSASKPMRDNVKEIKSNHSKHPSAELPNTNSDKGPLISSEEKKGHSRQSSADLAYSRFSQTAKEQGIKFMKPTHSKHSSIDLNKRNSKQGRNEIQHNPTPVSNKSSHMKPTHNKQCSLNFSPSHVKQPSLNIQPTSTSRVNRHNKTGYYNQGIVLNTQMSDQDKCSKISKRSQKKSFETTNYFIMPPRNNVEVKNSEPVPKSPKNKSLYVERNKFITELQKVTLEQMKAKKMRENTSNGKHERNISSTSRSVMMPKHVEQQRKDVQSRNGQQRQVAGLQERGLNKSISPMRNAMNVSGTSDSKHTPHTRAKRSEIKSFKGVINYSRAAPKSEERMNAIDLLNNRAPCNPKVLYTENPNPIEKLVEKTNELEGQVTDILHVVSSFLNEEVQLKEKVKTQEDQIKSLEDMLVKYEREVSTLKAGAVCKTEPCNNETKTWMRKDKSETRLLTTTDTSAYESYVADNSGQLLSKTSRRNRKISPFTINVGGGNIQSTKNEARKINDGLLTEYKNLMKKRQLAQKKIIKH